MNTFTRIRVPNESGLLDVRPLLNRLKESDPKIWREDTYLRDYPQGPFGDTESIILRFPPRTVKETQKELEDYNSKVDQHENIWLPVAEQLPEFKDVVYRLAYEAKATRIGRVMVNKLNNKGRIYAHADTPAHANYWCRFHIVIGALPGVDFRCGNEWIQMKTGEVWFFRNEYEHEVINNSGVPRIHMVVDLRIEEIKGPGYVPEPLEITKPTSVGETI